MTQIKVITQKEKIIYNYCLKFESQYNCYKSESAIAYFKNDFLHKVDGPAFINMFNDFKYYYINGEQLSIKEVEELKVLNETSTEELLYRIDEKFVKEILEFRLNND